MRFYVRVPGGEGGIGTKSHGHDSSIRIPNFSHIQGKLKRLNAAITESFLKPKKKLESETIKKEHGTKITNESTAKTPIVLTDPDDDELKVNPPFENNSQEDTVDSSENKILANAEPIIITSTSISISLEENVVPFSTTTTTKPKEPKLKFSSSTSSSVSSTSTVKPKITKGMKTEFNLK